MPRVDCVADRDAFPNREDSGATTNRGRKQRSPGSGIASVDGVAHEVDESRESRGQTYDQVLPSFYESVKLPDMTAQKLQVAHPYSRLAKAYDETIGLPAFHSTRRAFETLARRYGLRFRSAADVGCGTGLFARYLSDCWGAPAWAVDISPEMLRMAEGNCLGANVRLLRQDIRCLRLPEPVDLVTSNFDALNHLTEEGDLRVAFQRIAGNLRPGGHLYFDLVTPSYPLGRGIPSA